LVKGRGHGGIVNESWVAGMECGPRCRVIYRGVVGRGPLKKRDRRIGIVGGGAAAFDPTAKPYGLVIARRTQYKHLAIAAGGLRRDNRLQKGVPLVRGKRKALVNDNRVGLLAV
jgi:hypothetical protein